MSDPHDTLPAFIRESLGETHTSEADARELLGALASAMAVPPPASLRARLLATVDSDAEYLAPFKQRLAAWFDLSIDAMQEHLARSREALGWEAAPIPGVELFHFAGGPAAAAADCGLVRVAPQTAFPEHSHLGREAVVLLVGGYVDSEGRRWGAGDEHVMEAGTTHAYRTEDEGCLLAVRLDVGIEIPGVGRLGPG